MTAFVANLRVDVGGCHSSLTFVSITKLPLIRNVIEIRVSAMMKVGRLVDEAVAVVVPVVITTKFN